MNRRTLVLALLGLAVFAAVGAAIWFFMWRPVRFVDPVEKFSIRFSPEWLMLGAGEGANVRAARNLDVSEGGGGTGAINVFASAISNIPDAKAYRDWYMRLNVKEYSKVVRVQEGVRSGPMGEIPWAMFVYEIQVDKDVFTRIQVIQYYFVRGSKGYVVSCTALPAAFERFRRDFEEAVDSFRFVET